MPQGEPYCPACGFAPGAGVFRLPVPVGHPNFGQLVRCHVCNDGFTYSAWLRDHSGLVGDLADCRLQDWIALPDRVAARAAAERFVSRPVGWLTLWGGFGRGKTFLLAAVANALLDSQQFAYYQTVPGMLNAMRSLFDTDGETRFKFRFDELCSMQVLLLDELDKTRLTPWAQETLFELLDQRYRRAGETGTVLAMNSDPRQLGDEWGYLASRMLDGRFACVEMGGADVRQFQRPMFAV